MGLVPTRVCEQCGQPYGGRGKRFCSRSCRTTWTNLHANPAKSQDARAKISASRAGKATTTGRITPQEQRDKISASLRGRALTDAHRAAIGAGVKRVGCTPPRNSHLIGPAHPNWKGGTRTARGAEWCKPEYKSWRRAVLDRDGWACRDCGERNPTGLHAHHLKSWAEHPTLRYDIANGITVCRSCHAARHRGLPRPVVVGPRTLAELRSGQPAA